MVKKWQLFKGCKQAECSFFKNAPMPSMSRIGSGRYSKDVKIYLVSVKILKISGVLPH